MSEPHSSVHAPVAADASVQHPLHLTGMGVRADELKALLDRGTLDVDAVDAEAKTALHHATEQQAVAAVRYLLDAGANPNLRDHRGNTPLNNAVFQVDRAGKIVELLLNHGSDPTLANDHGVAPLDLAVTVVRRNSVEWLEPVLELAARRFR